MRAIASKGQIRASFIRWLLVAVSACVLCGFLVWQFAPVSAPHFVLFDTQNGFVGAHAFRAIWLLCYAVMGIALALVGSAWGAHGRGFAIALFVMQFALACAWPIVFFALRSVTTAMYVVGMLVIVCGAASLAFYRVRSAAGWVLLTSFIWVLYTALMVAQAAHGGLPNPAPAVARVAL